jgi:uncharacterized protein YrrD
VDRNDGSKPGSLWDISALRHFKIAASDGDAGSVSDVLFEDDTWRVRWLVVDTGSWFSNRKTLIHRSDLGEPDIATGRFHVRLTQAGIKNSRAVDADLPVSQQPYDIPPEYREIFDRASHGAFDLSFTVSELPAVLPTQLEGGVTITQRKGDLHLRSADTLTGFHIHARDGEIGHVADFILDDGSWDIRYLVVDTRNWLPARKIVLPPSAVTDIDWRQRVISVDATQQQVKDSPPFDSEITIDRLYEELFHQHYGWIGYWM